MIDFFGLKGGQMKRCHVKATMREGSFGMRTRRLGGQGGVSMISS